MTIRIVLESALIAIAYGVAMIALGILCLHLTGHLSWFWTADPRGIIGGNGFQMGDLHIWLH